MTTSPLWVDSRRGVPSVFDLISRIEESFRIAAVLNARFSAAYTNIIFDRKKAL
jgi:hypothetical protein